MALVRAVRHRVRERQESYVMTAPGGANKHRHCSTIDSDGDGCTTPGPDGHVHEIQACIVLPAGQDQHSHDMSAQRCSSPHEHGRCQA